jgi:antitoxin component YwqK of YwqJK toxin-antitoxin module
MQSTNKKIHTSLSHGTKKGLKNTKYISQIILNNSIYLTNSIHLNYILSLLLPISSMIGLRSKNKMRRKNMKKEYHQNGEEQIHYLPSLKSF